MKIGNSLKSLKNSKTNSEIQYIINEIVRKLKHDQMTNDEKIHGNFTGIMALDVIVLMDIEYESLINLLSTSKYFRQFKNYDKLWTYKIKKDFGGYYYELYDNDKDGTYMNYYIKLNRYAPVYIIPDEFYNVLEKCGIHFNTCIQKGKYLEELSNAAMNYLKLIDVKINYGDVVVFECSGGYRNDGKMIFDGTKFVHLMCHTSIDRFGSLPKTCKALIVKDGKYIHHDYWKKAIAHNGYIWINLNSCGPYKIKKYICKNGSTIFYTICEINNIKYTLLLNGDGDTDPNNHVKIISRFENGLEAELVLVETWVFMGDTDYDKERKQLFQGTNVLLFDL